MTDPDTAALPTDNVGARLFVSTIVLSALAVIVVAARVYGRVFVLGVMGPDDYCVIVALVRTAADAQSACPES